jgi:restriction system protein
MERMWMVRAEGGTLYDLFRQRSSAAIGWTELAENAKPGMTRQQLIEIYRTVDPLAKPGTAISGASQVWRFIHEIKEGDWVVTYSPPNRTYMIGKVQGASEYKPEWKDDGMALARAIAWKPDDIDRDTLSQPAKNSLGSTLTVFMVPQAAAQEVLAAAAGKLAQDKVPYQVADQVVDEEIVDPLKNVESLAFERIKDLISALEWDEMQELVAGILRAMGYKTQVSPAGPDRGKDIIASPDGFGFEDPRIVVEVKHRKVKIGAPDIRSFVGGRHKNDRGLYVSTGGFSLDAHYEADRASIPLTLWTLDNLVRALVEHYDATDTETKRRVPLRRMYWPA